MSRDRGCSACTRCATSCEASAMLFARSALCCGGRACGGATVRCVTSVPAGNGLGSCRGLGFRPLPARNKIIHEFIDDFLMECVDLKRWINPHALKVARPIEIHGTKCAKRLVHL